MKKHWMDILLHLSTSKVLIFFCALGGAALTSYAAPTVWYVDAESGASSSDGTTWASAYPDIQSAIDAAVAAGASETAPAEIWVATGSYTSTEGEVVAMAEHVDLYGGFQGGETELSQRGLGG